MVPSEKSAKRTGGSGGISQLFQLYPFIQTNSDVSYQFVSNTQFLHLNVCVYFV
ncbi:MAG: hypothetical protein LBQ24_00540 [Candidatus Peribacteria bacterium]|nr:hypothetical protein [Candidatus Peribacteria bacterium]